MGPRSVAELDQVELNARQEQDDLTEEELRRRQPDQAERDEHLVEQATRPERGDGPEWDGDDQERDRHAAGDELQRLGQEAHDDVERRFVAEVGRVAEVESEGVAGEASELSERSSRRSRDLAERVALLRRRRQRQDEVDRIADHPGDR